MKHPCDLTIVFCLCALLMGVVAESSAFDEADSYFQLSLDELTTLSVTSAGKTPEEVGDVPASVTIITREQIEALGWATLEEILANVPGLSHVDNYEDFLIGVRGAMGGSLFFSVNGVPQHPARIKALTMPERSRTNIPVEAIDRIEIVRGPMSVIYGNNAFFGSVNIITNELADGREALVSVAGGEAETARGFVRLGQVFDDGFVAANAHYTITEGIGGDYVDYMAPMRYADLDPAMHRELDGHLPHRHAGVDVSARRGAFQADLRYSDMRYGFWVFTPGFEDGTLLDLDSFHGALRYEPRLADHTSLSVSAVYSQETYDFESDFVIPDAGGWQSQGAKRLEGEVLLDHAPEGPVSAVLGYRYQQLFDIRNELSLPEVNYFADIVSDDVITHDVFGQLVYEPRTDLDLVAGVRMSRTGAYDYRGDLAGVPTPNTGSYDAETVLTPRVAAVWQPASGHWLKMMYGQSTQDNRELTVADREEIRTLELNHLVSRPTWTVSTSVYFNHIQQIARRTARRDPGSGAILIQVDNSGEWDTHGVESIVTLRPDPRVELRLSGAWQHSEDSEAGGAKLGYSPEWQARLQAVYRDRGWTVATTVAFTDEMLSDYIWDRDRQHVVRLGDAVDSHVVVGMNLRRELASGLFANLHASNLFDADVRYPASELADFVRGAPGLGRRISLSVGWDY